MSDDRREPMSVGKGIAALLVICGLIGGVAVWQIRQTCLVVSDACDFPGLVALALSDRLLLLGSLIVLAALIHITWIFVRLIRANEPDADGHDAGPQFNVSALPVVLVIFLLWLGGSMLMVFGAVTEHLDDILDPDKASWFVWAIVLALHGTIVIYAILWHVNDYFAKPVSVVLLIFLLLATLGSNYLVLRATLLAV